jgi:hypothetical protein
VNRKQIYTILIIVVSVIFYVANDHLDKKNENYPKTEIESGEIETEFDNSFLPQSTIGN